MVKVILIPSVLNDTVSSLKERGTATSVLCFFFLSFRNHDAQEPDCDERVPFASGTDEVAGHGHLKGSGFLRLLQGSERMECGERSWI